MLATSDKHGTVDSGIHFAIAADGSRAISVAGAELWIYELPRE